MRCVLLIALLLPAVVATTGCEKKRQEVTEEIGSQPKKVVDAIEKKTQEMVEQRAAEADEAADENKDEGGW